MIFLIALDLLFEIALPLPTLEATPNMGNVGMEGGVGRSEDGEGI